MGGRDWQPDDCSPLPQKGLDIEQQAGRIFQRLFHRDQTQHRFTAVNDAVVVAHRQLVHRTNHDLAVFDDRTVFGGMNAQNGGLWRVDDGR